MTQAAMKTQADGPAEVLRAAEATEKKASAELAAIQTALVEARAEVDALSEQIREAGPKDSIDSLVSKRATKAARVEAMVAREEHFQTAVDRAAFAVSQAREAVGRRRVEELLAAAKAKDAALTERVKAFRAELGAGIRELKAILEQANAAEYPGGGPLRLSGRGLRWAEADEFNAFLVAANVFPVGQ